MWPFTRSAPGGAPAAAPEAESRAGLGGADVPVTADQWLMSLGWDGIVQGAGGVTVTLDRAMTIPAFAAACNFLAGTLAALPLGLYQVTPDGKSTDDKHPAAALLHDAANEEQSSFDWRKALFDDVFQHGRGLSYIEVNGRGDPVNLWPIDPRTAKVRRVNGRRIYEVRDAGVQRYDAGEIVDIAFLLKADRIAHRSPMSLCRDALAMALASSRYGARVFEQGGLPPAVLQGPFQSGQGAARASDDIARALAALADAGRNVLAIPAGHELKSVAFNAEQMQLIELKRFLVEEIARVFALPPVFLQDLTHGTFANTEQQDLHFVKHTLHRWVKQFEQELTLKLFGRTPARKVEANLDGLLRGDIKTRMEAHAQAIQHGIYSPAHAARIEDHPVRPEADRILVQGAMVPIAEAARSGAGQEGQ